MYEIQHKKEIKENGVQLRDPSVEHHRFLFVEVSIICFELGRKNKILCKVCLD